MTTDSPYKFDHEDKNEHLQDKPLKLDSKLIPSEQYNNFEYADPDIDGFDGFDKIWNTLSQTIGICLIVFSELEDALEYHLHELISNRSDQLGMIITRQMTYIQKVTLFIDLLRAISPNEGENYTRDIAMLKKHLVRATEIRNIIAHAKWPSITRDGYVFSSVEAINANHKIPEVKYYRLNKPALENSRAYIAATSNMTYYIKSKYLD